MNGKDIQIDSSAAMAGLLKILPAGIKLEMSKFLYRGLIKQSSFFKDRPDVFYLIYLEKLKPMKLDRGEIVMSKGQKTRDVFFLLSGEIISIETSRVLKAGGMLGQDDIMLMRDCSETFKANAETFTMRMDKANFQKLLRMFPDI